MLQLAYEWKQEQDYGIGGSGAPRRRTPEQAREAYRLIADTADASPRWHSAKTSGPSRRDRVIIVAHERTTFAQTAGITRPSSAS